MKKLFIALFIVSIAAQVKADCTDVIALSKIVNITVASQDEFESYANTFCREYKKSGSSSKTADYAISYKYLSASMGKSGASESQVASRYCSAKSGQYEKKDAYKNYVETISPLAYKAYEECIRLYKDGIHFDVNPASILPDEMDISVSYSSDVSTNYVNMSYSSSKDVLCRWSSDENKSTKKVVAGSGAVLKCTRNSSKRRSYVKIIPFTSSKPHLTLSWSEYDDKGLPVNILHSLIERIEGVCEEMSGLSDSVVSFELDECPDGWEEYIPAFGRFIRGIDKSGRGIDEKGNRKPGDIQDDSFKKHKHPLEIQLVTHGKRKKANVGGGDKYGVFWKKADELETGNAGISETRPKNVSLLYCIKK